MANHYRHRGYRGELFVGSFFAGEKFEICLVQNDPLGRHENSTVHVCKGLFLNQEFLISAAEVIIDIDGYFCEEENRTLYELQTVPKTYATNRILCEFSKYFASSNLNVKLTMKTFTVASLENVSALWYFYCSSVNILQIQYVNKIAFQYDAYRPCVDRISHHALWGVGGCLLRRGCQLQGCLLWRGVSALEGGVCSRGVSALGGVCSRGGQLRGVSAPGGVCSGGCQLRGVFLSMH